MCENFIIEKETSMKKPSLTYAVLSFVLYFCQAILYRLLVGSFSVSGLVASTGSSLVVLLIIFIIIHKNLRFYGICICKAGVPNRIKTIMFILPLLNIPYLFIGDNGDLGKALVSGIFVGIMEELIFRGFLYRAIEESYGVKKAIVVSSLIFGLFHLVNIGSMPIYFILIQVIYAVAIGVIFSTVFSATGSLLLCMSVHALVDIVAVVGGDEILPVEIFGGVICILVAWYYLAAGKRLQVISIEK